ncbi:hypothetical protein [Hymenobacter mucosus]|uniref:Uncharacterized protein n=1 Tax=Hymenobacter mucosus TaxID=1411120 RepID=A0A239A7A2_9BACT|nr:hypothetical protein [Hymenobacter mucosus]SNR91440.1 hypothetical protein SAMN06269173_11132 [Hymenobacter mucosus]
MRKLWNKLGDWVFSYKRPKWFRDHIDLGKRVTIFGANAMHFMVTVRTKRWGVVSFRLISFDKRFPLSLYCSPNGTPWACTYCVGLGPHEKIRSLMRRLNFGHNFNSWDDATYEQLRKLNDKHDYLTKYKSDLEYPVTV